MKTNKIFMLVFAVGAMFLHSCSNDADLTNEESAKPATMVFTATMENAGDATRTVLDSTRVCWSDGDQITISNSSQPSGATFTAINADGTTTACSFNGEISSATPYYAVYPAQTVDSLSSGKINGVTLPDVQTAVAGSYDPAAALMVASSEDVKLQFKNVNTLIKVTPKFDCTKIIFDAKGTQIAGKVNVTPDATAPTWAPTSTSDDAKSVVTLTGNIQANQAYYIAILPNEVSSFVITLCAVESDDNGNLGYKKGKNTSYTFARNKIVNIGNYGKTDLTACKYTGQPEVNKPIVDFGLSSGLCWAKYNVGYESGKPYGDYFSWGYTEPLYSSYIMDTLRIVTPTWKSGITDGYSWGNYTYSDGSAESGVQPYTDGVLKADNDAATQKMESTANTEWHTPTMADFEELRQNTVWVYVSQEYGGVSSISGYKVFRAIDDAHKGYIYMFDARSGQKGYKWFKVNNASSVYNPTSSIEAEVPEIVTDSNILATLNAAYKDKTAPLFLPSSGCFNDAAFSYGGSYGYYWSSNRGGVSDAYILLFYDNLVRPATRYARCCGRTVRGVCL